MVGVSRPHSPPARDSSLPVHPGWPRSPFRGHPGGKEDEGGPSDDVSAADSWSIRSDYGSTLDGEDARGIDVLEVVPDVENGHQEDEKDAEVKAADSSDEEAAGSELGLQSHWDGVYAEELATFHEHGQVGEIWFGSDVMETMADWTTRLAAAVALGSYAGPESTELARPAGGAEAGAAAEWRVLDVGCGNGLLLHALAKRGFRNLTGSDYSEAGIALARSLAAREAALGGVQLVVDDLLHTQLAAPFDLVLDKGTLDAVGLYPAHGPAHRRLYQDTMGRLLRPGGLLVITSCNSTTNELIAEFANPRALMGSAHLANSSNGTSRNSEDDENGSTSVSIEPFFDYAGHVRTYPVFHYGGSAGTRVCTVAFKRKGSS